MNQILKLRDFEDADFNPFMEERLFFGDHEDPYPLLAELRSKNAAMEGDYRKVMGLGPDITHPDVPHFMILGYDEVTKALLSPQVFSNKAYTFNLGTSFGRSVSTMDAPEHSRFRRIFQKIFLPQFVKHWGTSIVDPVVQDLMAGFLPAGKADLIGQFTLHYPFGVIYRQLNLPPEEGKLFHKLAVAQTLVSIDAKHGGEASHNLGEYFPKLIEERRRNPGDDLVSLLAAAEVDGEYLPEDVLVSFFRQLINAAGDTTYRGTSVLLTKLLQNPDQLEALRQDRSLLPNAIEEALRFDGPVIEQARWAAQDTEVAGVKIPAGSIVHVVAGAANRDPAKFDDPDRFDIRRPNANRHVSFSAGPHLCIGQHLARVEMTRAITAILDNLHNLRLDPAMPAPQLRGAMMRVPHHLHVLFDPA
ncbi:MAG TPA: cytochrome P450 [Novosphingobium sp.]